MDWQALVETYGSPLYVYDLASVRTACRALRAALPQPSTLLYSVKANPHPALIALLASLGCGVEISSEGEFRVAVAAGVKPADMLHTGPAKSEHEVAELVCGGLRAFSVDSPSQLALLSRSATRQGVEVEAILRINPDRPVRGLPLSMTGTASQFGADVSWVMARPADFTPPPGVRALGLHFYTGTGAVSTEPVLEQMVQGLDVAARLSRVLGWGLGVLDLGGGFGHPHGRAQDRPDFSGLAEALRPVLDTRFDAWSAGSPRLVFESGRYLVAGCGSLLCTVMDRKRSKGRGFVILDAGINTLAGVAGLQRLPRQPLDIVPISVGGACGREEVDVVGPLCTPLDVWARGVAMVQVVPGDVVMVPNVGAYGLTASLVGFLGRPCPREVVVDGEEVVSVTELAMTRMRC